MTLSAKTKNDIKCIAGKCKHKYDDSKCLWLKIAEAGNQEDYTEKVLIKMIEKEARDAEKRIKEKMEKKNGRKKSAR